MINVGQKVLFSPSYCLSKDNGSNSCKFGKQTFVIGTIVKIYEEHSWCLVEYNQKKCPIRIGFKLSDIYGTLAQIIDENLSLDDIIPYYCDGRIEFKKVTE